VRNLLFLSCLLPSLVACSSTRDYTLETKQVAEYGINLYEHPRATCLIYRDKDTSTMSCRWKKASSASTVK